MTTDYGDLEVIRSFVADFRSSWPWGRQLQRLFPVVYDAVVAQAIDRYSHEFQRPDSI